jgi:cation transport regulator
MPYKTLEDLPDLVKNILPKHTEEIYKEAYNTAWQQYKDKEARCDNATREEVAHRVAWSAVKQSYKKTGKWQKLGRDSSLFKKAN